MYIGERCAAVCIASFRLETRDNESFRHRFDLSATCTPIGRLLYIRILSRARGIGEREGRERDTSEPHEVV